MKIFGTKVTSNVLPDVGRDFRALIKKLILELVWKPQDESFETFDRIISRVENGTGKSRPDRLRLPFKSTVNRFREKMGKWENKTGKRTGTGTVGVFFRPFSRFPFSAGKIPAGIPVFVVVGCVTCVGNVNCCLHVLQREL